MTGSTLYNKLLKEKGCFTDEECRQIMLRQIRDTLENSNIKELKVYCPDWVGLGCRVCAEIMDITERVHNECPCDVYGTEGAIKRAWITIDEELVPYPEEE